MKKTKVQAEAPSNIALIKYMGKATVGLDQKNIPTNSSLSWTIPQLRTKVSIESVDQGGLHWAPEVGDSLRLSVKGEKKFLDHFRKVAGLSLFGGEPEDSKARINDWLSQFGGVKITSSNNFPSDCGLASSASSFAALTRATLKFIGKAEVSVAEQAAWSRLGSGSSCRSFFEPWCVWSGKDGNCRTVSELAKPFENLLHFVVVVADEVKAVSSSEAHLRVLESSNFTGRPERAEQRLLEVLAALKAGDWQKIYEISWAEFWDMHGLFETCTPPFSYLNPDSLKVLRRAQSFWKDEKDGPVVTMDAGPNVHFLWRTDQLLMAQSLREEFSRDYKIAGAPF